MRAISVGRRRRGHQRQHVGLATGQPDRRPSRRRVRDGACGSSDGATTPIRPGPSAGPSAVSPNAPLLGAKPFAPAAATEASVSGVGLGGRHDQHEVGRPARSRRTSVQPVVVAEHEVDDDDVRPVPDGRLDRLGRRGPRTRRSRSRRRPSSANASRSANDGMVVDDQHAAARHVLPSYRSPPRPPATPGPTLKDARPRGGRSRYFGWSSTDAERADRNGDSVIPQIWGRSQV